MEYNLFELGILGQSPMSAREPHDDRSNGSSPRPRVVLHADMDAFYAAIEQRDRPELRGQPVIVGGTSDRGVVSAASYEARPFGVHSALPTVVARQRCPHGIFLRGDMRKYAAVSRQVFSVFRCYSPLVEGISLDEAFLDLTGTERLHGPPAAVGEKIRGDVWRETQLAVSVGIAPSKMVAKIASEEAKPDGLLEIAPSAVRGFLDPLPVERLWGIGPVGRERLRAQGLVTIGDLANAAPDRLERLLGMTGLQAGELARGTDPREVESERTPVSLSEENTFGSDQTDWDHLGLVVQGHAESVARRLRRAHLCARTVVLKVKLAKRLRAGRYGYPILTRRATLPRATDDGREVTRAARRLLLQLRRQPVRLIGVGATNLVRGGPAQLEMLEWLHDEGRSARLNRALDEIADRFGDRAVVRAGAEPPARAGLSLQHQHGSREPD